MIIYDVTMPIHAGMAVYKNREEHKPCIEKVRTLAQGSNETRVCLYSHAGTHVDAPYHMVEKGYTLEQIPLHKMYGKCRVWDLTRVKDCIELEHIKEYPIEKGDFIFLKTRNSLEESFNPAFIYLSPQAAQYLAEIGVEVVGTDALSIERSNPEHATHYALMEKDVLVVEGLRLKEVPEGRYTAVVAPIPIVGGDGSPARVLLIQE